MARLTPMSLGRGVYYYFVSLLAAFYLVFVHTASRQTRRILKATIGLLNPASYRGKEPALLTPTSSKAAAAAEAQAARLIHARADAALGMPLYKHHRDLLPASILAEGGSRAHALGAGKEDPAAPWSIARCPVVHRSFRTRDGTLISYHILYPNNPRTMVFANGLGAASDFSAFASVIHRYGKVGGDYSFLTWDYRGLFSGASLSPEASDGSSSRDRRSAASRSNNSIARPRRLAIPNHAEDLFEILGQEGIRRIDLLIGWSMGVQISLEFASLYPDSVRRLALLNGTYGSVFETAFQPFFRVPFLAGAVASAVEYLVATPRALRLLVKGLKPSLWLYKLLYRFILEPEYLVALLGEGYFARFLDTYMGDVLSSPEHTENYLRLFQELNAHSTYHLLKEIPQRTLVISGLLDCLTPAYQSFELARKLPHATHVVAYLSSHCVLLEQPKLVIQEIAKLVEQDGDDEDDEQEEATPDSEEEAARNEQWQRGLNRAAHLSAKSSSAARGNGANGSSGAGGSAGRKGKSGGFNPRHNSFAVPASATASAASSRSTAAAAAAALSLRSGVLRTSSDSMDRSRPEHSVARRRSAYFPSGSGSDSSDLSEGELLELGVDDHAALEFEQEVADVAAAACDAKGAEQEGSLHCEAHKAAAAVLASSSVGSQLAQEWSMEHQLLLHSAGASHLDPEAIPTEEELAALHQQHVSATNAQAPEAAVAAAKERPIKDETVAAAAASAPAALPASTGPSVAAATSSSSLTSATPVFPASARPVAVVTSELMDHRKADDRALIAALIAQGIPAEHVVWHAPGRAWSQYRAVVIKSPWGYFNRSVEWLRFLADLESSHSPVANSVEVLRWNSNKCYLRDMQTKREANQAAAAAASGGSEPTSQFDFIPTAWLSQSDLLDAAALESLIISRGWAGSGAVLKPTSSAGGFGTLRLPSVGNAEFARAVAQAAAMDLQPAEAGAPTWMLQPFQPQILTDGEYSFFFLLEPASASASASASSSGSVSVSGSPQLRFMHGGQKRPKSGSFLVQPTNGGILTAWFPSDEQIQAAREIIEATPFGPVAAAKNRGAATAAAAAAAGTKAEGAAASASSWSPVAASAGGFSAAAAAGLPDFLYVRIDCIRSSLARGGGGARETDDLSEGPLLLMEVEAIEPDYYSHLSADFDAKYFASVQAFLVRAGAWTPTSATTAAADEAQQQSKSEEGDGKAAAASAVTASSRSPQSSFAAASAFFADPLSSRVRGASAVRSPASPGAGVSGLIDHFEEAIADESAEAAQARVAAGQQATTQGATATTIVSAVSSSAAAVSAGPSAEPVAAASGVPASSANKKSKAKKKSVPAAAAAAP